MQPLCDVCVCRVSSYKPPSPCRYLTRGGTIDIHAPITSALVPDAVSQAINWALVNAVFNNVLGF
jgi:hypothetical protein